MTFGSDFFANCKKRCMNNNKKNNNNNNKKILGTGSWVLSQTGLRDFFFFARLTHIHPPMKSTTHRLPGDREGVTEVFFFWRVLEHVALSGCGGVGGQMRAVSHIKLLAGASSGSEETRRSQMIWRCLRIQQLSSAEEGEEREACGGLPSFLEKKKRKGSSCFLLLFFFFFYFLSVDFVLQQASSLIEQHPSNCWMTENMRCVFFGQRLREMLP